MLRRPLFPVQAPVLTALLPLLSSALVQLPIVGNYFKRDDFVHLYEMANLPLLEFLVKPTTGHMYVTRNSVFLLFHSLFGLQAELYFAAVVLTHVLNVHLLFGLLRSLTRRPILAAFGATLWGISPLHQGVLGWYSAYGHVLATTALLWIFRDLARIGAGESAPTRATLLRWGVLLLAAATSFGIALPIAAGFSALLWLLLPERAGRARAVLLFSSFAALMPLLYGLQQWLYADLSGWTPVPFNVKAGIALSQLHRFPLMFLDLTSFGVTSLLLGPLSARGLGPAAQAGPLAEISLPALIHFSQVVFALLSLVQLWVMARAAPERRRQLVAFWLIVFVSYATIALARVSHVLFLERPPEWMAIQPRYHYLGPMAVVVVVCLTLRELRTTRWLAGRWSRGLLIAWVTGLMLLSLRTSWSLDREREEVTRAEFDAIVSRIERAVEGRAEGANIAIPNGRFQSIGAFLVNFPIEFPGWAAVFMIAHPSNTLDGRRVHFVERNQEVLATLTRRTDTRVSRLLIGPEGFSPRPRPTSPAP